MPSFCVRTIFHLLAFLLLTSASAARADDPTIEVTATGGGAGGTGPVSTTKINLIGTGSATLRLPTGDAASSPNVVATVGGGLYGETPVGNLSIGAEPKTAKKGFGWLGSLGGDCSLVACIGGALGGVRIFTGQGSHVDLQLRAPYVPGIINRTTNDYATPLGGFYLGLDQQLAPIAHVFLALEADATNGESLSQVYVHGQEGAGFLASARGGMRFDLSKHWAALWQVIAQDQVAKHVDIPLSGPPLEHLQNSFGLAETMGLEIAY